MPGPFALAGAIFASLGGIFGIAPLRDVSNRLLYSVFPTAIPQHPDLISMLFKKLITMPEFNTYMRQNGYNPDWTEYLFKNSKQLLNALDMITLKRRGKILEIPYQNYMETLRLSQDDVDRLEMVTEFYPPPADLIRFAVREIYNPGIRLAFEMDTDFPEEFKVEAAKVGIPEQLARDFWAAHWDLPSVQQGYEMLHRGVITENQLDLLLKALDIMPGWREPLKEISYVPFTRVDVRRMYGQGVLDVEDVHRSYTDIGYNEEKAEKMTEFTVKYENETNIGLTRAAIVSAYIKGVIEMKDLEENLEKIGLSPEIVSFWVSFAEYERDTKLFEDWLNVQVKMYAEGIVSRDSLNALLNSRNLDATYIDTILAKADLAKLKQIKLPTKADLAKWFIAEKITIEEFGSKMSELGYRSDDILKYIDIVLEKIEPQ